MPDPTPLTIGAVRQQEADIFGQIRDNATMQAAAAAADGRVGAAPDAAKLEELVRSIPKFVPAADIPTWQRMLLDPRYQVEAVRTLKAMRDDAASRPVRDPRTDPRAYRELELAAMAGDESARQKILTMPTPEFRP